MADEDIGDILEGLMFIEEEDGKVVLNPNLIDQAKEAYNRYKDILIETKPSYRRFVAIPEDFPSNTRILAVYLHCIDVDKWQLVYHKVHARMEAGEKKYRPVKERVFDITEHLDL